MENRLTKGQKNEKIRQEWVDREKAINRFGYSIKSRKCGYGELDVTIWKDGVNIFPSLSWDYKSTAIIHVEDLIKKSKDKFYSSENDFTADDLRFD